MKKLLILYFLICNSVYASQWECLDKEHFCSAWRMRVPHGWLIKSSEYNLTFIPDEKHEWKI